VIILAAFDFSKEIFESFKAFVPGDHKKALVYIS